MNSSQYSKLTRKTCSHNWIEAPWSWALVLIEDFKHPGVLEGLRMNKTALKTTIQARSSTPCDAEVQDPAMWDPGK